MKKAWVIMCFLVMIQSFSIWFIWKLMMIGDSPYSGIYPLIVPLFICADAGLVVTVRKNTRIDEKEWELEQVKEQVALEEKHRLSWGHWEQELSATRAVLTKQLSQARDMLREWEGVEAEAVNQVKIHHLLDDIGESLAQTKGEYYCGHILSNIILCEKIREAGERRIRTDVQTAVSAELSLPDNEWCSIWCNLLDNAIEACEELSADKRWMTVRSACRNGYFYIKVVNSAREITIPYRTQKADEENHGFGLSILKELAEKYGGALVLQPGEGCHTAIFTIKERR